MTVRLNRGGLPERIVNTVQRSGPLTARHLAHYLNADLDHVAQSLRRLASRNLIQQDGNKWGLPHRPQRDTVVHGDWYDHRNCATADPTIFYNGDHLAEALTYCDACPVTIQCAALRVETERELNSPAPGIWGGQLWTLASVGQNGYRARLSRTIT